MAGNGGGRGGACGGRLRRGRLFAPRGTGPGQRRYRDRRERGTGVVQAETWSVATTPELNIGMLEGDGPGEFRSLAMIARAGGDTVAAYDGRNRRVSYFAADGGLVREIDLSTASGDGVPPTVVGVLEDGAFVGRRLIANVSGGVSAGLQRRPLEVVRIIGTESIVESLGEFPGAEVFYEIEAEGSMRAVMAFPLPFGRTTAVAAAGRSVYVATNDDYEVRRFDADGVLERLVRRTDVPATVVTSDILERYVDAQYERTVAARPEQAPPRSRVRSQIFDIPRVPTLPAYGEMLHVDAAGDLWVREFTPPWQEDAPSQWAVFDPDGRWLGTVSTPAGLEVHEIGDDYVLGVARDELDVERVRLHRLITPGS